MSLESSRYITFKQISKKKKILALSIISFKVTKILIDLECKHRMEVLAKIVQRGLQPGDVDSSDISTDTESR